MANRNRGRSVDDDDSVEEPIEGEFEEDLDEDFEDLDEVEDDEDEAPGRRGRGGAATRARTVNRNRTKVRTPDRPNVFGRIVRYIREIVAELQKVIRPTRKELLTYTAVVIVFVTLVMSYVAGLDVGFAKLMFLIFGTDSASSATN